MSNVRNLQDCFNNLSNDFRDYYTVRSVPQILDVPTPVEFLKKWVSPNKPVIFKNAVKHWPALKKWNLPYLRSKVGDKMITVAVTPNGYADAVCDGHFVLPEERTMTFNKFLDALENRNSTAVHYIQKQNSNMSTEFEELTSDVNLDISWASEAFGCKPDAVNFWMGDERAVTSMHKDYYENIYCVIKGRKEFILHPPIDLPWIPYDMYKIAVFHETNGEFEMQPRAESEVPWISIDPLNPDIEKYPLYKNATSIHCCVEEGDALYLPSLWFHHVRQTHGCIAVNYWYDMDFDIKFCYYKFLQNASLLSSKNNSRLLKAHLMTGAKENTPKYETPKM